MRTYSEMIEEIKQVKQQLLNCKSEYRRKDLYRYMKRLKKELETYEDYKGISR